ncbi:MAG: prevent-host-death protein [Bacteroidales bacterium]|nr:prevent-host-death protein [Bacteroidales bacterium]MBR2478635.1 prevent-host-death protein [Bacteroidales bacterium]
MIIVTSRDFRANQRKYFDLARTNDVIITSRAFGSYKLVPVAKEDNVIDAETLDAKIKKGIEEYNKGKVYKMNDGEDMSGFLGRMLCEE